MSFFSLFQIPPSFKKLILTEQKEKTTVCIIQITSRCTHFGFHQDKIKHLLNYWWNMNKVLPIIRQENNTGKDFFFLLFFWIKTISIEMQSYHTCQKIALQNMKTTEQRKWLLELERDLWWKPLKWVKFLFRTAVDCTLCFFLKKNSFTVTLHHTLQTNHRSAFQCLTHSFSI